MTDNTPQMDSAADAGTGFESVIGDPSADTANASQAAIAYPVPIVPHAPSHQNVLFPLSPGLLARSLLPLQ